LLVAIKVLPFYDISSYMIFSEKVGTLIVPILATLPNMSKY